MRPQTSLSSAPARSKQVNGSPSRRTFLRLATGLAAASAAYRLAWAQEAQTVARQVRVATGLLATWQSTAWLGAEAGLFKKREIDMTFPAIAVGGPQAAAGLIRGDWEFADTGPCPWQKRSSMAKTS